MERRHFRTLPHGDARGKHAVPLVACLVACLLVVSLGTVHALTPDTEHPPQTVADSEGPQPTVPATAFSFAVAADTRQFAGPGTYDTTQYFRGALEAIRDAGDVRFMVSPGDMDPVPEAYWTITNTLGSDFTWYPVVGNHELPLGGHESEVGANLAWLNSYDYGPVLPRPSGCPTTT